MACVAGRVRSGLPTTLPSGQDQLDAAEGTGQLERRRLEVRHDAESELALVDVDDDGVTGPELP